MPADQKRLKPKVSKIKLGKDFFRLNGSVLQESYVAELVADISDLSKLRTGGQLDLNEMFKFSADINEFSDSGQLRSV